MTKKQEQYVKTLQLLRQTMLADPNWETYKPFIEAVTAGGMAIQLLAKKESLKSNNIDFNKSYAVMLSTLMLNHPDLRVIAWIDTDGIYDDYTCMAGNLYEPTIETLIVGKDGMYHQKEDNPYDDCFNYYGSDCDDWSDEELEEKAKAIPWEEFIAVRVGVM